MRIRPALLMVAGAALGAAAVALPTLTRDADARSSVEATPVALSAAAAPGAPLAPLHYDPRVSLAPLVDRLGPSVVHLEVSQEVEVPAMHPFFGMPFSMPGMEDGQRQLRTGQGSGFFVSTDGYILTNNHVVDDAREVTVRLADERTFPARVVGRDPTTDVALVKIDGSTDFPAVPLGDSGALRVGDWVVAIGNPFGLDHSVSAGIVSGKGRDIGAGPYDEFLQTDASINPGNSGGPLFNLAGEVVGINTAIIGQGIGFAVPIDMVKTMLDDLKADGRVNRGWVGVALQDVEAGMADALGLPDDKAAVVGRVYPDTPAAKAGLQPGDVVTAIDGRPVTGADALIRSIGGRRPGEAVTLRTIRNGKAREVRLTLGARPDAESLASGSGPRAGAPTDESPSAPRLGIVVRSAAEVGAEGQGLVITRVDPAAPAHKRLAAGDRILTVNGDPIRATADLPKALARNPKGAVVVVARRGAETVVQVPFTER